MSANLSGISLVTVAGMFLTNNDAGLKWLVTDYPCGQILFFYLLALCYSFCSLMNLSTTCHQMHVQRTSQGISHVALADVGRLEVPDLLTFREANH